jgi:hypothetical protein
MPEFYRSRLVLDPMEAQLLRNLTTEYRALLESGRIDRGDPIYDRLFPSAYEAPKDEAAYRELIGDDLQTHKLEALDVVTKGLENTTVDVEGDDFEAWIRTLTDLRLAIGTRLEVDEERMAAEPDPRDPDAQSLQILHWLGWITEGLLEARAR